MKVIKQGDGRKGWAKEFECTGAGNGGGGCGAVLLVEVGDMFTTSQSYYDGSTDRYTTFQCCECEVLTDVKDKPPVELPTHAEYKAGKRATMNPKKDI